MQARHKPERLIISSFDDDDDDDDEDEDEHDGNVDDLCLPVEDGLEGPIRSDGRRFPNLPVDSENGEAYFYGGERTLHDEEFEEILS